MTTLTIKIERTTEIAGSCLQGYIWATRNELTEVFGKPGNGDDGYKVFHNWGVRIQRNEDELAITANIYDWKYDEVFPADEKIKWNIGGYSQSAVDAVEIAVLKNRGLSAEYLNARYAR